MVRSCLPSTVLFVSKDCVFNLFNILNTTQEQKLGQTSPFIMEFTSASDKEKYCCLEHKFKYLVIHQVKVKTHQTTGIAD